MNNISLTLGIMMALPALAMDEDVESYKRLREEFLVACSRLDVEGAIAAIDGWKGRGLAVDELVNQLRDDGQGPLHLVLNPFLAKTRVCMAMTVKLK